VADIVYQTSRAAIRGWGRRRLSGGSRGVLSAGRRMVEGGDEDRAQRLAAAALYIGFLPLVIAAELLSDATARHPVVFWGTTAGLLAQTATVVFGRRLRAWVWAALTFAVPLSFVGYVACSPSAGLLLWPALMAPLLWTALFRSAAWLAIDYALIGAVTVYAALVYPGRESPLVGPAAVAIRLLALAVVAVGVFRVAGAWRSESRRVAGRERRQRRLVEHLLVAHEEERRELAGHLHDDTLQGLAAGVIALGAATKSQARGETALMAARLEQATAAMQDALEDARRVCFQLRPALVSHYEIAGAIRRMVDQFCADTGAAVEFDADAIPDGLDRLVETLLYRTLAELLDNVRLHAHAQTVRIRVGRAGDVLFGKVQDDGCGLGLRSAIGKRRTLATMAEQFRAAGGSFRIDSTEQGTTVAFEFPLTDPGA
jgi:signal transduction histidine kinase